MAIEMTGQEIDQEIDQESDEAIDQKIDEEIDAAQARIEAAVLRCLRAQLVAIGRDWQRCGKAACARTRRCRGFACEPMVEDEESGQE